MLRYLSVIFLFAYSNVLAQNNDSIPILILDTEIQIESTNGINSLYNFEFNQADSQFRWLKGKYPSHPLPYFLLGLSQWWRIMPSIDNTKYDETFLTYMDSTILIAEHIFENGSEVEGAFFLSAAHAFKGRLYSERRSWSKAASEGKKALDYLDYSRGQDEFGPEILFGDALYNYYSVWIPETYPILKPIMMFFRDGDKELGLKQLKEVANNAFFTRTEAQYFLMRIQSSDGGDKKEALFISDYLHSTFPNNAYFHRYYARMLYANGQYDKIESVCLSIIERIKNADQGYEPNSGRYAAFFLGHLYARAKRGNDAKKYYALCVEYGEQIGAEEKGYHLHALLSLGEIEYKEGNKSGAKSHFKEVKKLAPRRSSNYKKAKKYLRRM